MTRRLFPALVLLLLGGCASTNTATPAASAAPSSTYQAQCETTGGQWRGGMCEKAQGGGGGY
jgi:hypothetical protein